MKPVQLAIHSTVHSSEEGDGEVIEQQLEGSFEERDRYWVLKYKEGSKESSDQVQTTVKAGSDEAIVIRQGVVNYRQTYRLDQKTYSRIEIPGGVSETEVETLEYDREKEDDGGNIRLSFRLAMGGEAMGSYLLHIQWKEEA
ncbi:DUF1934 domain-containing protein [Marininema halotolerans]|uniref:Uncharacterized beta-barrel protein YwiB, DUF1934 family n=1 Tax=Marininema halotolerans TaxID=1155944 RepID=A0A1I6P8A0_9BACL|nr:DUF1934 domain-containing protein [Marininema halotolerans]SFS36412.1 Uncharacterized beta-barrel protein YwiB, DUF1934 family [Marininema halotolerans]